MIGQHIERQRKRLSAKMKIGKATTSGYLKKEGKLENNHQKRLKPDQKELEKEKMALENTQQETQLTRPNASRNVIRSTSAVLTSQDDSKCRYQSKANQADPTTKLLKPRKYAVVNLQGTNTLTNPGNGLVIRYQRRSYSLSDTTSIPQLSSRKDNDLRRISDSFLLSCDFMMEPKPRPRPYVEKPFYLCPENGSFRYHCWQSGPSCPPGNQEHQATESRSLVDEEVRSLSDILPPITLPSIYSQECRKQKERKTGKIKQQKRSWPKKETVHDISSLTKNLSDCRYLRIPRKANNLA